MMRLSTLLGTLLMGASLALMPPAMAAKDKPVKPPTKVTQTLRADTYKKMEVVQKAMDAKDYTAALQGLDVIKANEAKLNDYERATLYNLYAAVYQSQERIDKAIEALKSVLQQPNLPEGLRDQTLFALAQCYLILERYADAVTALKRWFAVAESPSPDAYMLLAQAYYQQDQFKPAEKALMAGLRVAKEKNHELRESWLGLLRAVYYELGDYERAAKVLELLVAKFPSEAYYLQLSGMYGLMGKQKAQLATLHAAYVAGMLSKGPDLLNLARLYLIEEAPYPAARLLTKAFKEKQIDRNADNLQLYAQALSLARESEAQIPVLRALADMTNESKHYLFLGQAQLALGRWKDASESFENALKGKNVDDAANIRLQLGMAQFNAGQLRAALNTFQRIQDAPKVGESAANWVKFVSDEIARKEAMEGTSPHASPSAENARSQADAPTSAEGGSSASDPSRNG